MASQASVVLPGFLRTPLRTPRSEYYRCWSGPGPMSRSQTGSVTHRAWKTQHVSVAADSGKLSNSSSCAIVKMRAPRVAFQDLNCMFQPYALAASRDGTEARRIANVTDRDEAIAPKRSLWSPPAQPRRRRAGHDCADSHSPEVVECFFLVATRESRVEHDAHFEHTRSQRPPNSQMPAVSECREQGWGGG